MMDPTLTNLLIFAGVSLALAGAAWLDQRLRRRKHDRLVSRMRARLDAR